MRKYLVLIFSLFILNFSFLIFNLPALGQSRYATCDLCGYCPPNQPPSNWEKCCGCLYESACSDPSAYKTLIINDSDNLPPTPMPGRWYTMIGCINTNTDLGGFQQEGAAGSVVQKLLYLIFSIVGLVALLYFIYGSYLIITSQADPEKLGEGRRAIYGAIVGIIFSLSSVFLINLLASGVLKIPGFGGGP